MINDALRFVLAVARATGIVALTTVVAGGRLGPTAAWADTFVIPDGNVPALVAAIQTANTNGEQDIIELAANGTYVVDSISSSLDGGSAFPHIAPDNDHGVAIVGRGATIVRDPSAEPMRFFYILDGAYLSLYDTALVGGLIESLEGGGAILAQPSGTIWIERCILEDNESPLGSALYAAGLTLVRDTEVLGNRSEADTAAVVGGDLHVWRTTMRNNGSDANGGGAILALDNLILVNSTISGNDGYGVYTPDVSGDVRIVSSTIVGNTGSGLLDSVKSENMSVHDSVVAGNAPNCSLMATVTGDANTTDDDSCPSGGAFTIVEDARLEPLSDNGGAILPSGGSPWTMTPLHDSPLVDSGSGNECADYATDQLGKPRSVDSNGDGESMCDIGAIEFHLFQPANLEVDYSIMESDGNGVLEPGEDVAMAPAWRYDTGSVEDPLSGFTLTVVGPDGGDYLPVDGFADYGVLTTGTPTSCRDGSPEECYVISVDQQGSRPALHWDATAIEHVHLPELQIASQQEWVLHIGDSFPDAPRTNPFYRHIETMLHSGVTAGCTDTSYCPASTTSRQQMPVFVLRALEGSDYSPPDCTPDNQPFTDVSVSGPFCPWIQELSVRGVVEGCGNEMYCPTAPVSRAQMAVYSLKTLEGGDYAPPPCTSGSRSFSDVPATHLFCPWIEELARREIVSGCDSTNYCPSSPVDRAQMSVFVTRTFGLELYGP